MSNNLPSPGVLSAVLHAEREALERLAADLARIAAHVATVEQTLADERFGRRPGRRVPSQVLQEAIKAGKVVRLPLTD